MTREELRGRLIYRLRCGGFGPKRAASEADAVIRLVVEACAAKADECEGGFTSIGAVLRSTFLPPEARDGEAD